MGAILGFFKLIYRLGADPQGERQGWQSTGNCSAESLQLLHPAMAELPLLVFLEPEDWVNNP